MFSASVLRAFRLQPITTQEGVGGLGGVVRSVGVETQIRLSREEGGSKVVLRGQYAAVTEIEALEISVLGRDIIGLFALIVDRPGDVICLIGQLHRYVIEQR
ncbi:MAG: hypothetical protein ACRERE_42380 [Candidatus Entotheonellia bacterium]